MPYQKVPTSDVPPFLHCSGRATHPRESTAVQQHNTSTSQRIADKYRLTAQEVSVDAAI